MDLNQCGRYDLMYEKIQELRGRSNKSMHTLENEDEQGHAVTDQMRYLQELRKICTGSI